MKFFHHDSLWASYPALDAGVLVVDAVTPHADISATIAALHAQARERLDQTSEGEFPEIQAWRRVFSAMGLRPTQYRSAAESLLRRLRKEGTLPSVHPLIDLCNAVSVAYAVPIAVFDLARVSGNLVVRPAQGQERYDTFTGEQEQPEPGEVVFADAAGQAHARRWCHRQSGRSAVRSETSTALIVAEAMHADAAQSVEQALAALAPAVAHAGWRVGAAGRLRCDAPVFEFGFDGLPASDGFGADDR